MAQALVRQRGTKVLLLGHSFVRHFHNFLDRPPPNFHRNLDIGHRRNFIFSSWCRRSNSQKTSLI